VKRADLRKGSSLLGEGKAMFRDHLVSIIAYVTGLLLSLGILVLDTYFQRIPMFEAAVIASLIMILTFMFETRFQLHRIQITPRFFSKVPDFSPHLSRFNGVVLDILVHSSHAYKLQHSDFRKVLEKYIDEVNMELRDYCAEGMHRTRTHTNNKEDYAINLCKKKYRAVSVGAFADYWKTVDGQNVMQYCDQAIKRPRKVKVQRIFICDKSDLPKLRVVIEDNQKIGVEVFFIDQATLNPELKGRDFGIVDEGHTAVELVFDLSHSQVTETVFYYASTVKSRDKINELTRIWEALERNPNKKKYDQIEWT
jgi:fumarate reductase subunit D